MWDRAGLDDITETLDQPWYLLTPGLQCKIIWLCLPFLLTVVQDWALSSFQLWSSKVCPASHKFVQFLHLLAEICVEALYLAVPLGYTRSKYFNFLSIILPSGFLCSAGHLHQPSLGHSSVTAVFSLLSTPPGHGFSLLVSDFTTETKSLLQV
jgi:hypothetical protein